MTYLKGGGPRFVAVCDRGGVNLSKVACTTVHSPTTYE